MQSNSVAAAGVVASFILTVLVSVVTDTAAYVELAHATIAIYLVVGIAAPQYVIWRQTGSPTSLGLAAFAAVGGVAALVVGGLSVGLMGSWGSGVVLVLVVGSVLGEGGRSFLAGYRGETSDE